MEIKIIADPKFMPKRATEGSSGYDLVASVTCLILPGAHAKVDTGVQLSMPAGYEAQIRPRSGLASRGILGVFGTIDSDYTGVLSGILYNHSSLTFEVNPGDRIAQLVFQKVEHPEFEVVSDLPATSRGAGGFGHTGR